jgi:hypothetical protein
MDVRIKKIWGGLTVTTIMNNNRYSQQEIDLLRGVLQSRQNTQPVKKIPLRQVILKLKPDILKLHQQNWSWPEIVDLLAAEGIEILPNTLRETLNNRPIKPKQQLPALNESELINQYHTQGNGQLSMLLNSRSKVTLSRFYKTLRPQQKESTVNKMLKNELISHIMQIVAHEADKQSKVRPAISGEHKDLFDIDLGI